MTVPATIQGVVPQQTQFFTTVECVWFIGTPMMAVSNLNISQKGPFDKIEHG